MSIWKRILIMLAAVPILFAAFHFSLPFLGIQDQGWRYALAVGVFVVAVRIVWDLTAPKKQPPQSN